ncbi:MAG: type II toxin-antitoxin system RelB/DinJ family antitoxin [Eubacterium sp.]|nr:type II toxin-antitoxin system RelB/DinJ family antitoxin [Eubacterium sp.]
MASALVQFRTDETEKIEAIQICERLGMNLPSYLRMCMSRLVKEQGVPFSMSLVSEKENPGIAAMRRASQIAEERGISDITLDEINAEIAEARK